MNASLGVGSLSQIDIRKAACVLRLVKDWKPEVRGE